MPTDLLTLQASLISGRCSDGVLSELEVDDTMTAVVCNGRDGLVALVNLSEMGAGGPCEHGGIAIESGLDQNNDGLLSEDEIKHSEVICNGATGEQGAEGQVGANALVLAESVEPGQECKAGGVVLVVGLDANHDNSLDASEVSGTYYVCNAPLGEGGASGANGLVQQSPLLPGSACAEGGTSVQSGTDINGDGELTGTEVEYVTNICNGANGENGVDGASSIMVVTQVEPGQDCEFGGVLIESGSDIDNDGDLSETEVSSSHFICNGKDGSDGEDGANGNDGNDGNDGTAGAKALVELTELPPDTECSSGGTLVESGVDIDGDGKLSESEVQYSATVCNGRDGKKAASGLVAVSTEPAGADCPTGGVRVDSGLDLDENGELAPEEIESTSLVCNGPAGTDGINGQDGQIGPVGPGGGCNSGHGQGTPGLMLVVVLAIVLAGARRRGRRSYVC